MLETPVPEYKCATCSSYVHPYLDACASCGRPTTLDFAEAVGRWERLARILSIDEYYEVEGRELSGANDPTFGDRITARWRELAELATQYGLPAPDIPSLTPEYRQSELRGGLEHRLGQWAPRLASQLQELTFRYLGGLPGWVAQTNANLRLSPEGELRLTSDSGATVASPSLHQLLAVSFFNQDVSTLAWAGIYSGGMALFTEPTVRGGGLVVTYATGGSVMQFAVGDRPGVFSRKGGPGWYISTLGLLVWVASVAADIRALSVGPERYASELGLTPIVKGAVETEDPGVGDDPVFGALVSLDRVHDAGLVTDEEYAAKRSEILGRL